MRADSEIGMNRGIELTANAMLANERLLDVTSNNLANASTNGFKSDGLSFNTMLDQKLSADGGMGKPIGSIASGMMMSGHYTMMQRGPINVTSNPLDVAINSDKGLFAVDSNGQRGYTRDGAFSVNEQRQLVTATGGLVLDQNESPITLPEGQVKIGEDGNIAVDGKSVGKLGLWQGEFAKAGGNLFSATGQVSQLDPSEVQVRQGALEGSNVNAISEMMNIISLGRSFDLAQKSTQSQDELSQKLVSVLQ
jgi:flagellar basal-body rod protein FlgF